MHTKKQLTRILGLAAMATVIAGFAGAAEASASPVPPTPNSALIGTWQNTNSDNDSVAQIIIDPSGTGTITVDAFGACSGTLCEWGSVPATVYGSNVSSTTGASFQSNQAFFSDDVEWSRTTLVGHVARTHAGRVLTVRELTVFEDGSGRKNYNVTETFAPSASQTPTTEGDTVEGYRLGTAPALDPHARGTWKPVTAAGSLARLRISGSTSSPIVHAYGRCSPTACNWGKTHAITYGTSISSTSGETLLAPYRFSFKKTQLVITYTDFHQHERLTVGEYNEFTDGSGRANYKKIETLVRG